MKQLSFQFELLQRESFRRKAADIIQKPWALTLFSLLFICLALSLTSSVSLDLTSPCCSFSICKTDC